MNQLGCVTRSPPFVEKYIFCNAKAQAVPTYLLKTISIASYCITSLPYRVISTIVIAQSPIKALSKPYQTAIKAHPLEAGSL